MSEEPIYEFVKGKGWVPRTGLIVTMRCGTRVKLELRPPKEGDFWDAGDSVEYASLETWESSAERTNWAWLSKGPDSHYKYYCVFVSV